MKPKVRIANASRPLWDCERFQSCPRCKQRRGETCLTVNGYQAATAHRVRFDKQLAAEKRR